MISKFQGETIKKEIEVFNADKTPADLTGCEVTAGLTQGITVRLTPTITGNVVSIRIEDTSTMLGIYELEIKLKDTTQDIDVISFEQIYVRKSNIPNFTVI